LAILVPEDTGGVRRYLHRVCGDAFFPGDLNAGDVIALFGVDGELVVRAVLVGPGGYVITVDPVAVAIVP
jgi:hypothetical protein